MFARVAPEDDSGHLREASEAEYYTAKRQAAAVLGRAVRPGDLPSDAEVREQVLSLVRARAAQPEAGEGEDDRGQEPSGPAGRMGDHIDRFALYRLRLGPLHEVKQNPKYHPEGDALYHSLQVFELARQARPYDEEFLLAALLHDVGKAIDPDDRVRAALDALAGAITERTAWLIEHLPDLRARPGRPVNPKVRRALEESESFEDLVLLLQLDEAGRVPGAPVPTLDEALDYLRGLESEAYLDGPAD